MSTPIAQPVPGNHAKKHDPLSPMTDRVVGLLRGGGEWAPLDFSLSTIRDALKILAAPVLFFLTLPLMIVWKFIKYQREGGRMNAERKAATLPLLYASRLASLNQAASLKTSGAGVTPSEGRTSPGDGIQPFASVRIQNGSVTLHAVAGGDFSNRHRPVLLFLHGFPHSWSTWSRQLSFFAQLGFGCMAMDLRGHGASEAPEEMEAYTVRNVVEDVLAAVRWISEKGKREVVLIGHDRGGFLAWYTAFLEHHPDTQCIVKYIICNAPHPAHFLSYALRLDRLQLLRSWYMFFFQLPWVPELFFHLDPESSAEFVSHNEQYGFLQEDRKEGAAIWADYEKVHGMIQYYRADMIMIFRRVVAMLSGQSKVVPGDITPVPIHRPVLFLHSDQDLALGGGLATTFPTKRWTPHPLSRVQMMSDGVTHWIQQERPKELSEAMLKFVMQPVDDGEIGHPSSGETKKRKTKAHK